MSNSYIIDNTDGSITFVIEPGTLDGPGGADRNSDLYLYGQGASKWGEGVNESLYRLAENFACAEKEVTDTGYVAGVPAPKDEDDLGALGLGITTSLNGQLWYNTTDKKLYVYDETSSVWRTSSGLFIDTDPAFPVEGDLKYDSDYHGVGVPQLTVYTGAAFESVAHEYVELAGDDGARGSAMTGLLTLSGNPVNALHAVTKQYADNTFVDAAGDTMSGNLDMGANTITNVADPTTDDHVGDRGYNDARYLELAGTNPMAAILNMGSHRITSVTDPSSTQDAATKNYVDTALSAIFNAMFPVGSIFIGTDPTAAMAAAGVTSTWAQVTAGTFLMAEGDGSLGVAGATGGANTKTLTTANMPAHTHDRGTFEITGSITKLKRAGNGAASVSTGAFSHTNITFDGDGGESRPGLNLNFTASNGWTGNSGSTGSGTGFDNRPQFEIVKMYKRTA